MKYFRLYLVLAASVAGMAFAVSNAQADNHFLDFPVPVLPSPVLNSNSGDFDIAMADNGEAVAFWGQTSGMYASLRPAGGKFGAPIQIDEDGSATSLPEVAMTPNGRAVLVWRADGIGDTDQVYVSVKKAGESTFSPDNQVSVEPFHVPNVDPQVDIADDGTALVAWVGLTVDDDANSAVIRQRYVNGNGNVVGGSPTTISPGSAAGDYFPDVAVGSNGQALVTYRGGGHPDGDPTAYWEGSGNTNPDTQVLDTDMGAIPVGAVDSTGLAVVAYEDGNKITANYRPAGPGQNFLFDQDVTGGLVNTTSRPVIEMDKAGRATLAFNVYRNAEATWSIRTTDRPAGNGNLFGGTTTAAVASQAVGPRVNLAVGSNGDAMIGWEESDSRFYASTRPAGVTTFAPKTGPISKAGTDSGEVISTMDAAGKGVAAFSSAPQGGPIDYSIDALPYDDAPVLTNLTIPATAVQGVPVDFSVAPTDVWADVAKTEWTLDPEVVKTGNQVTTTYLTVGNHPVTVKVTDSLGNTTSKTVPVEVKPDVTPPLLTKVSIQKKKAKVGRKNAFRFTTNDEAKIVITVKRTSKGKGKKNQGRIVKANIAAGKRKIGFRGKVGKKKLKPARYKATLVAIDRFGNRSKPKSVGFRIVG